MSRVTRSENYGYKDINEIIRILCEKYSFLERLSLGKSVVGRDIPAVRLGEGESYTLFAAAFHGSEHITSNICLMFLEEMAYAYENRTALEGINIRKALEGRGLIFVPRVNPDGCEISISGASAAGKKAGEITRLCGGVFAHWNANFRGVDINHNFDADFDEVKRREIEAGIYTAGPSRFGGSKPNSEPETAALVSLCERENIHHVCAMHTQGEVIYWGYKSYCEKRSKQMAQILAATSGYALDVPQGTAVGGGFKDWFVKTFERPGFTIEFGRGRNPLPIEKSTEIYLKAREMLTVCAIL
ncbi:MAG: gamma-D-glutamyl-meso-diaminopimelate peptidase [Clostridia bacterium]|nr:gamma-D-glutamyl-meso-diaminopimelate peptidase [Clostridia bacterium]